MVGGMNENDCEGTGSAEDELLTEVALPGRRRQRDNTRRTVRLTPRFSAAEWAELAAAAASVGMTVNGFTAEAALNAARGIAVSYGPAQDRETLARLQRQLFDARNAVNRFGGNVNQAVAALHSIGHPPAEALERAVALCARAVVTMDTLIGEVHRRLR
jgi:hypothetical protein